MGIFLRFTLLSSCLQDDHVSVLVAVGTAFAHRLGPHRTPDEPRDLVRLSKAGTRSAKAPSGSPEHVEDGAWW